MPKLTNIFAFFLLAWMILAMFFSVRGDSLTMDELSHLPAGYSYVSQKDMRINPEHPPLVKDLAGIPLLFIKSIKFPYESTAWKDDVNGQWAFGSTLLFHSGNPADKMIFWGRLPMLLFVLILGIYIFKWSKELFGNKTALLSLFLFSMSPTFLAHGRLVTTDVAAATAFFVGTYYFVRALRNPVWKNIVIAGIVFGIAELLKFSVIILAPLFIFFALLCWWPLKKIRFIDAVRILITVFVIGFCLVWIVYLFHTWNYPVEKQVSDTRNILTSYGFRPAANFVIWLASIPVFRAFAHYLLGLLMVFQRAAYGNTTYFLGEVSAAGWKSYFPIVYAIKEPLAFHILTLIAVIFALSRIKTPYYRKIFSRLKNWLNDNFAEFAMLCVIAAYWAISLRANLNIGVRHLLPAIPFTIVLISRETKILAANSKKIFLPILTLLLTWQAVTVIKVYPHFLTYFNELAGGPDNGYKRTVDSNLDWGQDLKRLKNWVEKNGIEKIYVDYFGGADAEYYLGDRYLPWNGQNSPKEFPKGNYLAVSVTFLQGGRGKPVTNFDQPHEYYAWLDDNPTYKIGRSIFVYYIK